MMDPGSSEHTILVRNNQDILWSYGEAPQSTHKISTSRTATVELQVYAYFIRTSY